MERRKRVEQHRANDTIKSKRNTTKTKTERTEENMAVHIRTMFQNYPPLLIHDEALSQDTFTRELDE